MLIFEHSRSGRRATAQAPYETSEADDLPAELFELGTRVVAHVPGLVNDLEDRAGEVFEVLDPAGQFVQARQAVGPLVEVGFEPRGGGQGIVDFEQLVRPERRGFAGLSQLRTDVAQPGQRQPP